MRQTTWVAGFGIQCEHKMVLVCGQSLLCLRLATDTNPIIYYTNDEPAAVAEFDATYSFN